jgi:hypothetical protein
MKHLKTFEKYEDSSPKTGDYVILSAYSLNKEYNDFINNEIGKITRKTKNFYYIKYDYVPYGIRKWFTDGDRTTAELIDIKLFGKTKEEIELKKSANKFNL